MIFWQDFSLSECKWSPHSTDLSRLDFFLRCYLKSTIYKDAPESIVELKKIEEAIREIDTTMCLTVLANLLKGASLCLTNEGVILNTYCDLKLIFLFKICLLYIVLLFFF